MPSENLKQDAVPLGLWDCIGILIGIVLTLSAAAYLSRGRLFWEDEMLGWMLLNDPSWHHMVDAWEAGADGGGFSFYLIGRAWFFVAGASDLAFRLYSATCFALAFTVIWLAARRFYRPEIVAFACFNTFFFSRTLVLHMREGRFYGLLTLAVALAVWLALILAEKPRSPRPIWYPALFAIHGLLTTSHLLGVVFSFTLLAAMMVLDLLQSRLRPLLYLAGAASWLLLFFERFNVLASVAVGKPHFWIKAPTLPQIFAVYDGNSPEIAWVVLALLCLLAWHLRRADGSWKNRLRAAYTQRKPVFIFAGALLLIPVEFLFEGLLGTPIFNSRYLLPVLLGVVFVTAEALHLVRPLLSDLLNRHGRTAQAVGTLSLTSYIALLLFWVFHHVADYTPSAKDYTAQLAASVPKDLPLVCEDAFSFTELIRSQQTTGVRYHFLLDWEQTLSQSAPPLEVTQFHLMETWKKVGYFSTSIQPLEDFLRDHDRFYVLHTEAIKPTKDLPEIGNPLVQRFMHDPNYETRELTQFDRTLIRETIWLVCRGACGQQPPTSSF